MSKSKNNFSNPDIKEKSKYRLWVIYTESGMRKYNVPQKKQYFGFITKKDGGLSKLVDLFLAREQDIAKAIIYDNQTKTEFKTLKK